MVNLTEEQGLKVFRAVAALWAAVSFGFAVLCIVLREHDPYWILHMLTGLFAGIAMALNYISARNW